MSAASSSHQLAASSSQQLAPSTSQQSEEEASIQNSIEEQWYLKEITFKHPPNSPDAVPKRVKIVTQNFNGSVQLTLRKHEGRA